MDEVCVSCENYHRVLVLCMIQFHSLAHESRNENVNTKTEPQKKNHGTEPSRLLLSEQVNDGLSKRSKTTRKKMVGSGGQQYTKWSTCKGNDSAPTHVQHFRLLAVAESHATWNRSHRPARWFGRAQAKLRAGKILSASARQQVQRRRPLGGQHRPCKD